MKNPFHPIEAVAIDLDGTLLAPDLSISERNQAAIEELSAQGIHIILASGRHYLSMLPHARKLGVVEYLVSAQGAYASDIENSDTIFESHMPTADAESAIDFGLAQELAVVIYAAQGIFTLSTGRWIEYYSALAGLSPILTSKTSVLENQIFKIVYFADAARLDEVENHPSIKSSHLYSVRSLENIFEQADPKTSKRAGLSALLKRLGIKPENVASFGDANNDVPMFQLTGFSVAMDHAWPAAKRAARLVAPQGDPSESFARAVELLRNP